jgi:NADPH-dependent curcumin reductase CurA
VSNQPCPQKIGIQVYFIKPGYRPCVSAHADRAASVLSRNGPIKWKEPIVEEVEHAPKAFIDLSGGENFGEMIIKAGLNVLTQMAKKLELLLDDPPFQSKSE